MATGVINIYLTDISIKYKQKLEKSQFIYLNTCFLIYLWWLYAKFSSDSMIFPVRLWFMQLDLIANDYKIWRYIYENHCNFKLFAIGPSNLWFIWFLEGVSISFTRIGWFIRFIVLISLSKVSLLIIFRSLLLSPKLFGSRHERDECFLLSL